MTQAAQSRLAVFGNSQTVPPQSRA